MNFRTPVCVVAMAFFLASCDNNTKDAQSEHEMAHAGPAMNFHRINARLATGGHFVDAGIAALAEHGVSLVIDLRDEPPEGLKTRLADVGIRWVNVPVVWKEPELDDYIKFSQLMSDNHGEDIFVQCQGNYRASAMTYAYRVKHGGVSVAEARKDLEAIWTPEGTWAEYIDDILESSQ